MAPLPFSHAISYLTSHLASTSSAATSSISPRSLDAALEPRSVISQHNKQQQNSNYHPGSGAASPENFNGAGFIALFALLGAGMVVGSLWFFFWAKNGGFHFGESDWDDYKSTVLRRKGPDGKTLSNATKSTKLGGSSIAGTQRYQWQKQAARTVVGRDEKGRKGVLAKRGWGNTHSILYSDDSYMTETFATPETVSDMTEVRTEYNPVDQGPAHAHRHDRRYRDRDVDQYKREKVARVGGINRVADGSHYNGSDTLTDRSEEPMLRRDREEEERAERRARDEAARMERRWKREAEAAAAALAAESRATAPPTAPPAVKKSSSPSKIGAQKTRGATAGSPRKSTARDTRDFSYTSGPASEVLSTAYTGTTRTASSYYDEYRPARTSERGGSRQSSPRKHRPAKSGGGYRRGADSDLD